MSVAANLIGGGLVKGIGSIIAGTQQAAGYQDAANQANQTLTNTNNQIRTDFTPYTSAGSSAITALNNNLQNGTGFAKNFTMSDFYNDPGYQFTLQQGQNAVNNSAAARGGLLSGGAAKGLASYNTGLANQTYNDAWNRYMQNRQQGYNELMGVAGMGQNALNTVSNAGLTTGTQQAQNTFNALTGAADARSAGIMGMGNGVGGGMSSLGQYYAYKAKKG